MIAKVNQFFRTKQGITAAILFFLLFLLFLSITDHTAIGYGDSAELITTAFTRGVPHPPSYPLYMLMGFIPTHLSFLNPAFGLNAFSAFCQALCCVFVFMICLDICTIFFKKEILPLEEKIFSQVSLFISLATCLTLAFSFTFFLYAGIAEVFPLQDALISITLFSTIQFWKQALVGTPTFFTLLFSSIFLGLALSNHQTIILLLPAIGILIGHGIWVIGTRKRKQGVLYSILFCTVPICVFLVPYIYLPIIGGTHTLLNWNNPTSLSQVLHAILRSDYAPKQTNNPIGAYTSGIFSLYSVFSSFLTFTTILLQHFLVGGVLGFIGIILIFRRICYGKQFKLQAAQYIFGAFICVAFFGTGYLFLAYAPLPFSEIGGANFLIDVGNNLRVLLQAEVIFALFIPISLYSIIKQFYLKKILITAEFSKMKTTTSFTLLPKEIFMIMLVCIASPLINLFLFYPAVQNTNSSYINDANRLALQSLPHKSIVITFTDFDFFTDMYLQQVQGIRKDLIIIPANLAPYKKAVLSFYPHLFKSTSSNNVFLVRDVIARNINRSPIFLSYLNFDNFKEIGTFSNPYYTVPYGTLFHVVKDPTTYSSTAFSNSEKIAKSSDTLIYNIPLLSDNDYTRLGYINFYATNRLIQSYILENEGMNVYADTDLQIGKKIATENLAAITLIQKDNKQKKLPIRINSLQDYIQSIQADTKKKDIVSAIRNLNAAFMLDPDNRTLISLQQTLLKGGKDASVF